MPPGRPAKCPLCGGARFGRLAFKFGGGIWRCRRCGFAVAFPAPTGADLAARYQSAAFLAEYQSALHAGEDRYDPDFIRRHYHLPLGVLAQAGGNGKKLLDVGAGLGFFLKVAEAAGWQGEGVEISQPAADYARRVTGVRVKTGTLAEAGYGADSFDGMTYLDVIEHLERPLDELREAFRVLRPGGVILLQTPDLDSLSRVVLGRGWAVLSPAEHLSYFSARTLRLALLRTGFEVVAVRNLLVFDPDYTHRKGSLVQRRWKRFLARWEKLRTVQNIHGFEGLALSAAVGRGADAFGGLTARQAMERRIYLGLKRWLRGDVLMAVGRKP